MPDEPNGSPPPPTELRRRPQKKMSAADKKVLLDLCNRPDVRVNGKIHVATISKLTGISVQAIYGWLDNDKFLKAQLGEVDPDRLLPDELDLVDRNPAPTLPLSMVQFSPRDAEEAAAIRKQELKVLAKDWQGLGMSEEQARRWERNCKLGAASNLSVIRGVGGQLIGDLTSLDELIEIDVERLKGNVPMPTGTNKRDEPLDPHQIENDIRYRVFAAMNLRLQIYSHLHRNMALVARAMADFQKLYGTGKSAAKGDFESRGEQPAQPAA